jgi:predicted transcriptional regulator
MDGIIQGSVVAPARPRAEVQSMSQRSAKQRILEAVERLPEDATIEDAMERLNLLAKVERGLAEAEAGRTVPLEEVRARFTR